MSEDQKQKVMSLLEGGLKNDEMRNGEQPVIYEQAVHRFILLQADITCIGLLDLGIYRFE